MLSNPEKQFLYKFMLEEQDPQAALDNYRDENRSEEETVLLAEKLFKITD